ncbi:hypothetical protein GLOIN_2v1712465 [Rhizophagus irregularis DAOM 181602=DAOM 197198]|nr:hypothetical protein GLOIN_2v1712465 [Rhizophagus irregularis DAOM 181602=DAOM 197198]
MPTISRTLRETLFTQGNTRKLDDDDFKLYKDSSGCAKFSSKVQNLEEEINSKLIKLKHNITTSSTITTTTSSNSTSSTTTTDTTTASTSSNSTSSTSTPITTNNKSKKIHTDIDKLTKNIVDLVENIMPPTFLQSYHLQYKLHKVVLYEYNKYIDEVYVSVNNISNRLSTSDNYSYVKNKERKKKSRSCVNGGRSLKSHRRGGINI